MDSETYGYLEKTAFSNYFCKMAFYALNKTGSIFGSISQQYLSQFAAKNTFLNEP